MKNIGTKSVNISDIMVYLDMVSTTIDKILCFWVLIRWKWVIILLFFGTPNYKLFLTKNWDFFWAFPKFHCFLVCKASLMLVHALNMNISDNFKDHWRTVFFSGWVLSRDWFWRLFGHKVYLNSPMSIPVSLAPFLGQISAWFNFGGPGNAQDRQIWNFRKFEKSTYLASK